MPIATRLTNTGTLLVNGSFDETTSIAPSQFRTTANTVYAGTFDEVTNAGGAVAKREVSNGTLQLSGIFDEFTGAPVVDTSLKLWLDAGQTSSYSGSGSTWTDLSTSVANVTLYNSPAFDSKTAGGAFTFVPASSQYGDTATNLGNMPNWTAEVWIRVTSSLSGIVTSAISNAYNGSVLNFSIGTNNAPSNYNLCVGFFDGAWRNTVGFTPTLNTWYQVVGTYNGTTLTQYVNGAISGSAVSYTGTPSSGGVIRIARRWDDIVSSTNLFPGNISIVRVYNRALTADEVTTNFNAQRNRYGI